MCGPKTPAQPAPSFNSGLLVSATFLHCVALFSPRQPTLFALLGPAFTATAASCLSAVDCCGKCGVTASFATPKWNSCGKQRCRAKFATRERLDQQGSDNRMLFIVANAGLQLHLPHQSEVRVANSSAEPDLPHGKGWTSRGLTIGCYLLWQMWGYSFICHNKMEFVWQTAVQSRICHTGKVGPAGD